MQRTGDQENLLSLTKASPRSTTLAGVGVFAIDTGSDRPEGFAYCDSTSSMLFGAGRVLIHKPFRFMYTPEDNTYSLLLPFQESSNATIGFGEVHLKERKEDGAGVLEILNVSVPQTLLKELGCQDPTEDFHLWRQVEDDHRVKEHVVRAFHVVTKCCERIHNRIWQNVKGYKPMDPMEFARLLFGLDKDDLLESVDESHRKTLEDFYARVAQVGHQQSFLGQYLFECKSPIGSYLIEHNYNPYTNIHYFVDKIKADCVGEFSA